MPQDTSGERLAWLLTGFAFAISAISGLLQGTWGAWAVRLGPESPVWHAYVRWAPVGNHGRTFLFVAWGISLLVLPFLRKHLSPRIPVMMGAMFLMALVLGGVVGWVEGAFIDGMHYVWLAAYGHVELLIVLAAVIVALPTRSMDWLLWVAISIYAVRQALSILWEVASSSFGVPGAWTPPLSTLHAIRAGTYIVMIALALYRLQLARRGMRVPALLDLLNRRSASAFR